MSCSSQSKILNMLIAAALILGLATGGYGLDCYDCIDINYDGGSNTGGCYNPQATATAIAAATPAVTCSDNDTDTVDQACVSQFTLVNGLVTEVYRDCVHREYEIYETAVLPPTNECVTNASTWPYMTETTECYFYCTSGDKCNSETSSSLRTCATKCNSDASPPQGHCDYITGTCVCNYGWEGPECGMTKFNNAGTAALDTTTRNCVQCNSETDSACVTSTTSVDCPGGQQYCSTTTTTSFDATEAVIHTVTTRGCATAFIADDECFLTNTYYGSEIFSSGYNVFTCYSTCDTNGCNTNIADGVLNGNEAITLQCVICDDISSCATKTARDSCPSGSTHCKATAVYLISNKVDLSYNAEPAYQLIKIKRECATAPVTKQCTESSIGTLSFKKVTCQETCKGDGCNTGWPARPTCLSCSSTVFGDGYDQCLENPDGPRTCTFPYQAYCYIYDQGIEENKLASVQGYTRRIKRGCSHYDMGSGCSKMTPRGTVIEQCNYTCITDGCNVGSEAGMPIQNVISVALATILSGVAQFHL